MHSVPVGAVSQDDGNVPRGVFLNGSLPAQPAEALEVRLSVQASPAIKL